MGIKENIELKILGKAIKPENKPLSDEFAERVKWTALGSISAMALAAAPILPAVLRKRITLKEAYKLKKIPAAIAGMAMVPVGWNVPRVHNAYLDYLQGKSTKEEAQEAYAKLVKEEKRTKKVAPTFFKESSLLSTAARFGSKAGKSLLGGTGATLGGTRRFILTGLKGTPKTVTAGGFGLTRPRRTVLGGLHTWGVRGGVGALAATGIAKGTSTFQSKRRLSGQNYTTFLRNNVLAGNIKPEQLSQSELIAIRRMGIR